MSPGWWNDEQDLLAHIEDDLLLGEVPVMIEYCLINQDNFGSYVVDAEHYLSPDFAGRAADRVRTETLAQALSWWSVGENRLTQISEGVWKAEKELCIRSLRNARVRPAKKKHNELEIFIEDGTPTALAQCCHCCAIYHQEYYPEQEKDLYEFDEQYAVLSGKNAECAYCLETRQLNH
jgi:hypothetical protein